MGAQLELQFCAPISREMPDACPLITPIFAAPPPPRYDAVASIYNRSTGWPAPLVSTFNRFEQYVSAVPDRLTGHTVTQKFDFFHSSDCSFNVRNTFKSKPNK